MAPSGGRGQPAWAPELDLGDSVFGVGFGDLPKMALAVAMGESLQVTHQARAVLKWRTEETKNPEPAACCL